MSEKTIRLFYANVWGPGAHYELLGEQIKRAQPDIVALVEPTETWVSNLKLKEHYPWSRELPRSDNFGIALYSKYPMEEIQPPGDGDFLPPVINASIKLNDRELYFALLHARPPLSNQALYENRVMLRRIGTLARHSVQDVIVAGDFNATPFSDFYSSFGHISRLDDAMRGFGLMKSWNAWVPFANFTIDHVFYRGNVRVKDFKVLEAGQSDHYPYLVDFGLLG